MAHFIGVTSPSLLPTQAHFFNFRMETSHLYMPKKTTTFSHFLYVLLAGSLQNSCRGFKTEEAEGSAGLFHLTARRVLLWSPRRRWYNLFYKSTKSETIWSRSFSHRFSFVCVFFVFAHRSPEVLPQGTSWTSNDVWPVRRVDAGL